VLALVETQGYQPARVLTDATFDAKESIFSPSSSDWFGTDTAAFEMTPTDDGRGRLSGPAFFAWEAEHRNIYARVSLYCESSQSVTRLGEKHFGAGVILREGVSVMIDACLYGMPAYTVETLGNHQWSSIVPWTESRAVERDVNNTLEVVAIRDRLWVYVNGQRVPNVPVDIPDQAGPRFYLRVGAPEATYTFDDLVVVALEPR
jgi:hypothetical protein